MCTDLWSVSMTYGVGSGLLCTCYTRCIDKETMLILSPSLSATGAGLQRGDRINKYMTVCLSLICNLDHTHTHLKYGTIQFYAWQTPTHESHQLTVSVYILSV